MEPLTHASIFARFLFFGVFSADVREFPRSFFFFF